MITQFELKNILSYDKDTGLFTYLKQSGNRIKIGQVAGSKNSNGYIEIKISGKNYKAHRLAFLYVEGLFPENEVDHINFIRNDSRFCNLRKATKSQNLQNTKIRRNNKSGVKGIYWHKASNKWQATCTINGDIFNLGLFDDISIAEMVIKLFRESKAGEFANHGVQL